LNPRRWRDQPVGRHGTAPSGLRSLFHRAVAAIDPLRIGGLVLFAVAWQACTLVLPEIILPRPLAVIRRLWSNFLGAPALSYYAVAAPNFYANLIYRAENVAIAVIMGAAIGIVFGLISALLFIVCTSISYWVVSHLTARMLDWAPPSQRI
jgi:ABC-type nitrate/sulfonate/bicarbonate transport system permease component